MSLPACTASTPLTDKRLIPQFEDVIGGFASVRGYPEAYTSGDDIRSSSMVNTVCTCLRVLKTSADTDAPDDPTKPPPPPSGEVLVAARRRSSGRPDLDVILRLFLRRTVTLQEQ